MAHMVLDFCFLSYYLNGYVAGVEIQNSTLNNGYSLMFHVPKTIFNNFCLKNFKCNDIQIHLNQCFRVTLLKRVVFMLCHLKCRVGI